MAKNTNVLKSGGPDAVLEVKSAPRASAQSKSSARLRNKRAMMKGFRPLKSTCTTWKSLHLVPAERGGGAVPPQGLIFSHPAIFPECTALPVQESVFLLVLVFW